MTNEKLNRIIELVENLAKETDTDSDRIVQCLTGYAWGEEDAGIIVDTIVGIE